MEINTNEIYHSDHLGSSSYITDNFGRPSHYYEYLPFGELMTEHNQSKYYIDPYPSQNMDSYNNPYKFNGKEMDKETGMYYYGARYYDPRISIFVSVDPLAEQTMTPYQYVYNNPVNLIDPTGMAGEDWYLNDTTGDLEWINGSEQIDGYTHLGEDLTFHFSSFIDRTSWNQDKGAPWAPFDVSGEKLYSTVNLDFSQDKDGNLIGLNSVKWSTEIMTNDGGFKGVEYNMDGFINDTFFNFSQNSGTQSKQWLTFSLEKHAKVPFFEAVGIMFQGGNVVNVAQKLNIVGFGNKMQYSSYTDIFPSASLSINNVEVMRYMQPAFSKTHTLFGRPEHQFYPRRGLFNYGQPR